MIVEIANSLLDRADEHKEIFDITHNPIDKWYNFYVAGILIFMANIIISPFKEKNK